MIFDQPIDVALRIVETKSAHLFKDQVGGKVEAVFLSSRTREQAKNEGWIVMDLYTASLVVTMHASLSAENRAKFQGKGLAMMAHTAFALMRKIQKEGNP